MAEYIEIGKLLSLVQPDDPNDEKAAITIATAKKLIRSLAYRVPKADVAPVRRGEWQGTADGYADGELVYDMWNCSECGFDADGAEERPAWKFCPNCGAYLGGADNAAD